MGATPDELKAPFPYMGGKSKVADLVWRRLGNVDNFLEPFAGSLAVLLRRPAEHFKDGYRVETCNDVNHYIVNFWRAVTAAPDKVAEYADWPVTECDLHARHRWLMNSKESLKWRKLMVSDPEHFNPRIAGWWVHGACSWIGSGWCASSEPAAQIDDLSGGFGTGVGVRSLSAQMPNIGQPCETGGSRPQLTDTYDIGRGVNAGGHLKRPMLPDGGIRHGVNQEAKGAGSSQIPLLSGPGDGVDTISGAGTCDARRAWLVAWMRRLADRLRLVRTLYGHWSRICDSDSTLTRLGLTGAFLDPPYCLNVKRMHEWVKNLPSLGPEPKTRKGKAERSATLYASDAGSDPDRLVAEVHLWCLKWGQDPLIRICIAGYEGEHNPLEKLGWEKVEWATAGGYGNQGKNKKGKNENAGRERLWFNPACVQKVKIPDLFDFAPEPGDE